MKKEIWKRMLCVATATVVCLTSIPGTVFADEMQGGKRRQTCSE